MDICRACLCTDSGLKIITEDCLRNYNLLTQLEVQIINGLPQTMCPNCWNTIDLFIEFRNKCIKADATLRNNMILVNGFPLGEMDSKQELKLEEEVSLDNVKFEIPTLDKAITLAHSSIEDININDVNDDSIENIRVENEVEIAPGHKTKTKCRMKAAEPVEKKQGKTKVTKTKKIDNNAAKELTIDSPIDDDIKMPCGLCEKYYHNRDSLFNHLEDHKKNTTCSLCEETHKPWPKLLGHRLNHLEDQPHSCLCHLCWEPHSQDYVLQYHYFKVHYDGEFPGLECKQCCKRYPTTQRLKRHIWAYHSSKQYICDYCSKVYHNKHHLSNHIINHSNEKRYFCDKCVFACKLKGGLTEHKLRKHTDVQYKCKGCHAKFGNQDSFEKHKTRCQMYVICPTCGKSMNKTNLIQHMKTHSDEKPHKCDRCPATYKSKRALLVHVNKHHTSHPRMGEKRFSCTICDKRYTANHNLKIHLKTHGSSLSDRRPAYQLFGHR